MSEKFDIGIDQLQIGLYVELDLKWFEHPFAFGQFKIKTAEQLATLRSLGLKTIRYVPALSDAKPGAPASQALAPVPEAPAPDAAPVLELSPEMQAKHAMMERIRAQRAAATRIEQAFVTSAKAIRDIEKNLFSQPAESLHKANELIDSMVDSILCAPDLAIHVMGDKTGGEELYYHSLNVTMLSMMIARDIKLPAPLASALALGALLHDIGHKNIPDKILTKIEPLTKAERNFYELHGVYGVEIAQRLGVPGPCLAIISDHHEAFDGSGFPGKIKGEKIGVLPQIVAIANTYDELCNPPNIAAALTPHEALSTMFARLKGKFEPKLLQVFIRCLGVYPPGTIVELSNGLIGMVATVNTAAPTKPVLVIHDASVPKEEAILVDMERETELHIVKSIRPGQLPAQIYAYLSPRKRVSYYADTGAK